MPTRDSDAFPVVCPHDPIQEVATDVFFVGSTIWMNKLVQISRNMVVVRSGNELTLVNPVRVSTETEAQIEKLGRVAHALRLGPFHGRDDPYTVERFGTEFWCQPNSPTYPEPKPDHELKEGGPLPVPDAALFEFRETKIPECALLLERGDGILLTCDSLQHYGDFSRQNLPAKLIMPLLGFGRRMLVGPMWLKGLTKKGGSVRPDFERLLALEFDALISAHGVPLMHGAKEAVRQAVERAKFDVHKA